MRKKYWVKIGTASMIITLLAGLFFLWTWLFGDKLFSKNGASENSELTGSEISISDDGYWIINGTKTSHKAVGTDGKNGADGKNGTDGKDGINGKDGTDGADGENGTDGITPTVEISSDGYWIINGTKTSHKAVGTDGKNGINGKDGTDGADGENGTDGVTPTVEISADGYWVINGTKTTHKAVGTDGKNGIDGKDGTDGTDGENGTDGVTPTVEISADGYWIINGTKTSYKAIGTDGTNGEDGADGTNGTDGINGSDGNGIAEMKIEDGCLFVRYTNDPLNWVNLGKVTESKVSGTTADGLNYEEKSDGTLAITEYTGSGIYLEIPEAISGKEVSAIESGAFSSCFDLLRITIPKTVSEIEDGAFVDCFKLLEIYNLSDSLTFTAGEEANGGIAKYALSVHTSETEESILEPYGEFIYTQISGAAYLVAYKGASDNVVLPDYFNESEYRIYGFAFYNNTALKSLTVSKGVKEIGKKAFSGCTSITEIVFNAVSCNASDKNNDTFASSCANASVIIGADATCVPAYLFCVSDSAAAPSVASVSFKNAVKCTVIDAYAFANVLDLVSLEMSASVMSICANAFVGTSLSDVTGFSGVWSGEDGVPRTFATAEDVELLKKVNNGFARIGG